MSVTELVGKRALLQLRHWPGSDVDEYTVIELSPSGQYVRLRDGSGEKLWAREDHVTIIEVLADPA